MNETKRVICLYRVSGKKQVDFIDIDDKKMADIPMQRTACREFAARKGWTIIDEKKEAGVSGYKVSASDRDAIIEIKERALRGEFDVLLVFLFDRIGRITRETPFIVEWLIENGIEVWSTEEGEQRIDNHTDRLTNYITYWQSEGESRKTAIRTKTRMGQLVEEGQYMGGTTTYGYTLQKSGKVNKRGHDLLELVIDDYQAEIVRTIFDLFINRGYGPQRITTHLTEQGIMSRSGKPFHPGSIRGILRNGTYDGYLKFGQKRSQRLPNIVILEDGVFQQAQEIIAQRSKKHQEKEEARSAPVCTTGHGLLSGNVFCGHCGSRLSMATSVKKMANGYQHKRYRYSCYGKLRRQTNCCGQTGYTMHIVDDMIREVVHNIFIQFGAATRDELVGNSVTKKVRAWKTEQKKKLRDYEKAEASVHRLNAEIAKSLSGESDFTPSQLSAASTQAQHDLDHLKIQLDELNLEIANAEVLQERLTSKYNKVVGWSKMFNGADEDEQRMIVSQLINRVTIRSNYEMSIDLNIDVSNFNLTCLTNISVENHAEKSA